MERLTTNNKDMVIHTHHSPNPITGEMKRIINIDTDVAGILSDDIIEVEFYSLRSYRYVHKEGQFKLTSNIVKKYYVPNLERLGLLNDIWCSCVICFLLAKYKPSHYIEEWRLPKGIKRIVKQFSKKTRIILDLHGAAPEEYVYSFGSKNSRLESQEKFSVKAADLIVCQSDEMKRHLVRKHSVEENMIIVYRCGVDMKVFNFDKSLRAIIRSELGIIEDELVFVYSGGMHKWQKVKDALVYYLKFHKTYLNSKMLILTKDISRLNSIISENGLDGVKSSLIVKSLTYNEVPAYLCASDVAFLIRDNVVMNAVASPTKLAEYMACGLPIISSKVAEKWVSKEGLDFIFDIENTEPTLLKNALLNIDKMKISDYSMNNMSLEIDRKNVKVFFAQV